MLKYGKNIVFNPKVLHPLNIDRQSLDLIPRKSSVLDIGCATGFIGNYLKKHKNCKITGVELGKNEAKIAKNRINKLIVGNIEDEQTIYKIKEKYDIVFASSVIEHLKDPLGALKTWKKFIKKEGFLIVTTSNIAHWSIRLKLLRGNFNYEDYGILDNTHLRFYTIKTFKKLVRDSGYNIDYFSIDPVSGGFPKLCKILSIFFPNIFAYQMLIVAKPWHANVSE